MLQLARHAFGQALFICSLDAERQTSVARPSPETSQKTPLKSQPTKADGDQSFGTHAEESDVVVDEVADHADLLRRLSLRLEQAGGEDRGQFFTWHAVEVATLLNPAGKTRRNSAQMPQGAPFQVRNAAPGEIRAENGAS